MKTLFTFITAFFLFASVDAKIVYLNNSLPNPNISENLFTSWTDAYSVVSNGDTIYVFGTQNSYGRVTIDKKLTILGPGYYLTENKETQVNKLVAGFDQISFVDGSQGSYIQGITDVENFYSLYIAQNIDDITIENCFLYTVFFDTKNASNTIKISLKKNTIGSITMENFYNGIATNLIISNNIIRGSFYLNTGSSGIIANNLLLNNSFYSGVSSSFEIANNIYLNTNTNNFSIKPLPDASVHNNISLTGAFGSDNNNITVPQSTLFITDENATTDGMYMLSENSPAKGAGSNGTDIGPFGGPDPYRLSGLPNLPNIYELSTVGLVSGDKLPVTIKIKQ